jgi:tRNA U34 5-carboxymethylaminomethyl modifying enzyme MnmG/GidA
VAKTIDGYSTNLPEQVQNQLPTLIKGDERYIHEK